MSIKTQIDGIIDKYGTDVTVISNTISSELDEWGEPVITDSSSTSIKAVKDRDLVSQLTLQSTGRVTSAGSVLIVKAEETFDIRADKINYSGQDYNITSVQELELSNELLAQILEIAKD